MPQFDVTTFLVQSFGFSLALGIFYFVYLKFVLSQLFTTLRLREKVLFTNTKSSSKLVKNELLNYIFSKI
jgi:hypothetical protein